MLSMVEILVVVLSVIVCRVGKVCVTVLAVTVSEFKKIYKNAHVVNLFFFSAHVLLFLSSFFAIFFMIKMSPVTY